jgi:hypothetical protein
VFFGVTVLCLNFLRIYLNSYTFFRTDIFLLSSTIQAIKTANFESIYQRSYNANLGEQHSKIDINASTSITGATTSTSSTSSRPVPFSSREKLKNTPQVLSNYFNSDPDLQFTIEGFDDISMLKKTQTPKRSSKPLAWFLNEQLEKNSMETIMDQQQQEQQRETPSPSVGGAEDIRKCSVDSLASSINSTKISENCNKEDGQPVGNKKRGKKAGRQRVKKVSVNFTIAGSENKEPVTKLAASAVVVEDKQPIAIAPASSVPNGALLMNNTKERKEDYWYYDPLSDGFYYENNGSRGWKKRNPKVHGPPPAAAPKKVPEIEKLIEQQKLQKLTNQKLLNQIGVAPSVKYYDPATDGYFFEMASVDGWRRRQAPAPSSASSSSSAITVPSSVANYEQRKPMNIPTSTINHPSSSSSMMTPNINNQHHGYHPFGSFSSTTATPVPSPAGSFMPQPPAMTNAQLEEMIVRHPSLVASMSKNRFGGIFDEPCAVSNSSTTSSEELTSSPPPIISSVPEHSLLMQHFRRGQNQSQAHLQQSNSASMLINGGNNNTTSSSCQTNNAFSVGSADEPYEFYWSDNEKASSISSYDDMGDKEQSIPRENVIGGQRRPTTLSVIQDKSKPWWDTPLVDHRFDVDKFIADLPSFDDEKMLRNLTALPTPLSDRHSINQQQQHSNLITPLKEPSWWYGSNNANSSNNSNNQNSAARNLEKIDYDKIWRTPIIN